MYYSRYANDKFIRRLRKQGRCLFTASHCYPNWEIRVRCKNCRAHVRVADPSRGGGYYVCGKCKEAVELPAQSDYAVGQFLSTAEDGILNQGLKWFKAQSRFARFLLLLAALLGLWLIGAWTSGVAYDRDCRDFDSHSKAQWFYHLTGGPVLDFHHLDGDDDGKACERLP